MTKYPFLSDSWQAATNRILAEKPRPAVPPIDNPRLDVTVNDGSTFALVIEDRRPQFTDAPGVATATVTSSREPLRRAFLDGRLDLLPATIESSAGNRETLLYFLYHLYPDGPAGAAATAKRVRSHTTAE